MSPHGARSCVPARKIAVVHRQGKLSSTQRCPGDSPLSLFCLDRDRAISVVACRLGRPNGVPQLLEHWSSRKMAGNFRLVIHRFRGWANFCELTAELDPIGAASSYTAWGRSKGRRHWPGSPCSGRPLAAGGGAGLGPARSLQIGGFFERIFFAGTLEGPSGRLQGGAGRSS